MSTTSIDTYIPQLKARGVIFDYEASTPPLWLWIFIGFMAVLLVPLAIIMYLPVKKKKTD